MLKEVSKRPIKRKSISLDMKIEILNRLEKGEGSTSIAKSYGMNESTVRTIKRNEKIIRRSVSSSTVVSSKYSSYTRDATIETMEKSLMIWIEDHTQKGIPIDSNIIRHKAVKMYNHLKDQSTSSVGQRCSFTGSKGWFENFKKRHSLHSFKIKGDATSTDKEVTKECSSTFSKTIEENSYTSDQVFNTDEIGLLWKKMPNRTYLANTVKAASSLKNFADHDMTEEELINIVSENNLTSESSGSPEESTLFTAQNIGQALRLATELENMILNIDPNIKRALKFQQHLSSCCAEYREIYKDLIGNGEKMSVTDPLKNVKTEYATENEAEIKIRNVQSNKNSDVKPTGKKKLVMSEKSNNDGGRK